MKLFRLAGLAGILVSTALTTCAEDAPPSAVIDLPPEVVALGQIFTNGAVDMALTPLQQVTLYLSTLVKPVSSQLASNGFGDRLNSYAWSMAAFDGDLYVGTGRYPDTFQAMWASIWRELTPGLHPPQLPDAPVLPFAQDWLMRSNNVYYVTNAANYEPWKSAGQAEIWRLKRVKQHFVWERVHQSRLVRSVLKPLPPETNTFDCAETMGFRSMAVFRDQTRASALFAFTGGVSFSPVVPLVYRTVDGTNWTPLVTPAEMGRETRASAVHKKRLYVGVGANAGAVWCTDTSNPASTNWVKVLDFSTKDSTNSGVVSLISFNGKLYVGTENIHGYQIWCGSGTPGVDDWVKVVSDGAVDRFNAWAGTMAVYKQNLYVGSVSLAWLSGYSAFKGFDLIRIRPNNTWELVVGGGMPVDPAPGTQHLRPISGWASGFGNPLNFYCWNLCVSGNRLYLGSFDGSVFLRYLPYLGTLPPEIQRYVDLVPRFGGADLWQTSDGRNWGPVSLNGLGDPGNYGVRTMTRFKQRLIIGTGNPFDGCKVLSTPRMKL